MGAVVVHVEKVGRRTVDEYEVQVGGDVIATAHCVGVPDDTWSVMVDGRFRGLARGRDAARAILQSVADRATAILKG